MTVNYWNVVGLVFDIAGVVGLTFVPARYGLPGIARLHLIGWPRVAVKGLWGLIVVGFLL